MHASTCWVEMKDVFERQSSPGVSGRLLPVERGPGRSTPRATAPLVHLRRGRLSKQDVEGQGWGLQQPSPLQVGRNDPLITVRQMAVKAMNAQPSRTVAKQ